MKRKLLISNIVLYGILYSMSWYGVGFHYGDRWDSVNPPRIIVALFPALVLILLAFGIYFLCQRNKITPIGYLVLAGFTLAHIPLAALIYAAADYMRFRYFSFPTQNHFSMFLWAYIPAIVIAIIYVICAFLTRQEYEEIRRKRREAI